MTHTVCAVLKMPSVTMAPGWEIEGLELVWKMRGQGGAVWREEKKDNKHGFPLKCAWELKLQNAEINTTLRRKDHSVSN